MQLIEESATPDSLSMGTNCLSTLSYLLPPLTWENERRQRSEESRSLHRHPRFKESPHTLDFLALRAKVLPASQIE
jgi:hypothetical protein